jgi:hypothetical protein
MANTKIAKIIILAALCLNLTSAQIVADCEHLYIANETVYQLDADLFQISSITLYNTVIPSSINSACDLLIPFRNSFNNNIIK